LKAAKTARTGIPGAVIVSATEDGILSDLIGTKAAYLYAENVELASTRLYYTLLAIRMHKDRLPYNLPQTDLEKIGQAIGLADDAEAEEAGLYLPVPSQEDLSAVIELSEGLRARAFSVIPYRKDETQKGTTVINTTLRMMRGKTWPADTIPVLDQRTLDRMEGFTRVTLRSTEPDTPGPLASRAERVLARRPWLANEFLGHMPTFPGAKWDKLMNVREQLRPERDSLLSAMRDLSHDMSQLTEDLKDPETPGAIAKYAAAAWELKVRGEIDQIEKKLGGLRAPGELSRFVTTGTLTSSVTIAVGLGAIGLGMHHPDVTATGFVLSLTGLTTSVVQQIKARGSVNDGARVVPCWFLQQASEHWGKPSWTNTT
jgi:hypothetical protein